MISIAFLFAQISYFTGSLGHLANDDVPSCDAISSQEVCGRSRGQFPKREFAAESVLLQNTVKNGKNIVLDTIKQAAKVSTEQTPVEEYVAKEDAPAKPAAPGGAASATVTPVPTSATTAAPETPAPETSASASASTTVTPVPTSAAETSTTTAAPETQAPGTASASASASTTAAPVTPAPEASTTTAAPETPAPGTASASASASTTAAPETPEPETSTTKRPEELAPFGQEGTASAPEQIAPFGREDTSQELQNHAAKTQDTLVDAVENAEVAEIKRAVFRTLTRLRAAEIKEFDTIARLETQAIDEYNDNHHYLAENPIQYLDTSEGKVEEDKYTSFHN